jgi:hypothetical protein
MQHLRDPGIGPECHMCTSCTQFWQIPREKYLIAQPLIREDDHM